MHVGNYTNAWWNVSIEHEYFKQQSSKFINKAEWSHLRLVKHLHKVSIHDKSLVKQIPTSFRVAAKHDMRSPDAAEPSRTTIDTSVSIRCHNCTNQHYLIFLNHSNHRFMLIPNRYLEKSHLNKPLSSLGFETSVKKVQIWNIPITSKNLDYYNVVTNLIIVLLNTYREAIVMKNNTNII